MAGSSQTSIAIVGLLNDVTFHTAKSIVEDLCKEDPDQFRAERIEGMLEFEWELYKENEKKRIGGEAWNFQAKAFAYVNGQYLGTPEELLKWAEDNYGYRNFRPMALYMTLAEEEYAKRLTQQNHEYVYMDISIGEEPAGKLVFELFSDTVPKTCENFRSLCTGEKGESETTEYKLCYKDAIVHRVVRNGWIQGGDIWLKRGDGGESVYGSVFEDENFAVSHNRRGMLGMANKGRHTNGSQFYVTLQPATWMDTKYVAFGQLIEGTETLKAIEEQETINERPLKEVRITDCGVFTFEF